MGAAGRPGANRRCLPSTGRDNLDRRRNKDVADPSSVAEHYVPIHLCEIPTLSRSRRVRRCALALKSRAVAPRECLFTGVLRKLRARSPSAKFVTNTHPPIVLVLDDHVDAVPQGHIKTEAAAAPASGRMTWRCSAVGGSL